MFKLIVFDLDGTLVDSRKDLAYATNRLLVEYGAGAHDEDAVVRMVGEGAEKLIARAFRAAGRDVPEKALARFLELYGEHLTVHTQPYAGVRETLEALHPFFPLAVLTNKPVRLSEQLLADLDLARFFRRIVGGDGPFPRKPDAGSLLALAQQFHASPAETLLVGDSVFDLRTARAACTPIVLASYGFGFRDIPRDEIAGDETTIGDPRELVSLVLEQREAIRRNE